MCGGGASSWSMPCSREFCFLPFGGTYLKDLNPWLGACVAGAGYTALVRLQFTTLPINGKNTPLGIATFYEGVKSLVHKRINRIIRAWRMEQSEALAQSDIGVLRQRGDNRRSDALLTDEQRKATCDWIEKTATDGTTPEADRRVLLAVLHYHGTENLAAIARPIVSPRGRSEAERCACSHSS